MLGDPDLLGESAIVDVMMVPSFSISSLVLLQASVVEVPLVFTECLCVLIRFETAFFRDC